MSNQDWDIFEVETGLLREIFGPESSANDAANCSTTLQCAVKNPGLINMFLPGSMLRSLQWHDLVITGDEDPCEIHGIQVEVGLQQAELWYCHYTFFSSLVLWCVCVCVYVCAHSFCRLVLKGYGRRGQLTSALKVKSAVTIWVTAAVSHSAEKQLTK